MSIIKQLGKHLTTCEISWLAWSTTLESCWYYLCSKPLSKHQPLRTSTNIILQHSLLTSTTDHYYSILTATNHSSPACPPFTRMIIWLFSLRLWFQQLLNQLVNQRMLLLLTPSSIIILIISHLMNHWSVLWKILQPFVDSRLWPSSTS